MIRRTCLAAACLLTASSALGTSSSSSASGPGPASDFEVIVEERRRNDYDDDVNRNSKEEWEDILRQRRLYDDYYLDHDDDGDGGDRAGLRRGQERHPPLDDLDVHPSVLIERGLTGLPKANKDGISQLSSEERTNYWTRRLHDARTRTRTRTRTRARDLRKEQSDQEEQSAAEVSGPDFDADYDDVADADSAPMMYRSSFKCPLDDNSIMEIRGSCVRLRQKRRQSFKSLIQPGTEAMRKKERNTFVTKQTREIGSDFDFGTMCKEGSDEEDHEKCAEKVRAVQMMGTAALSTARSCEHMNMPCAVPNVDDIALRVSTPVTPLAAGELGDAEGDSEWTVKSVKFNRWCGLELEFENGKHSAHRSAHEGPGSGGKGVAGAGSPASWKEVEITILYDPSTAPDGTSGSISGGTAWGGKRKGDAHVQDKRSQK